MPRPLAMVIGFVSDKDVDHIFPFMPKDALYFFTRASIPRAMAAEDVAAKAHACGLNGTIVADVATAVKEARNSVGLQGMVFVGGSTFVVADYIKSLG